MASTSETRVWDAVVTSTLMAEMGDMKDNIVNNVPLLNYFEQTKAMEKKDGGQRIKADLMYGKNSTVKSKTAYELLDVTPQAGITAAFYDWKEIAGTLTISRLERRQNSGKHKMFDLIQAKKKQLLMSFYEEVNEQLFGAGTGNNLEGLQVVVPDTPTTQTYGGISRSTESWWRNQYDASVGSFAANGLDAIRKRYRLASRSYIKSPIDLIIMDGDRYDDFEAAHVLSIQFPVSGKMSENQFNLGIENFKYKKATVIEDPELDSTGRAYGLNSKFIKFVVDKESSFVMEAAVTPSNQTATVAPMILMANLALNNARKQFCLSGLTA